MTLPAPAVKPYHHGDLASSSLRVAVELLAEVGLEGFSLREVARRLGVSLTALYHHFPDKESLLNTIAQQGMEEFRDRLARALEGPGDDPQAPVVRMGMAYIQFFVEKPYYQDLIFLPMHKADAVICAIWQETFRTLTGLLSLQGWKDEDVPYLGIWLWSSVHGLATMLREGILGRPETCLPGSPAVFALTGEELVGRVTPLIASVLRQAVSLPQA